MSSVDRWRPPRVEAYQPPGLPPKPPVADQRPKSPAQSKRPIPPPVPSPPSYSSRTSPPRPGSRRSAPSPPPREATPQNSQQIRANQWFFTPSEAASTPSAIDGISPVEERLRRAKGVNFIYQAGILLELPQVTLWVAGVFFHRFYMRFSMMEEKQGIHHYNIAATALFLANKTEENCRKTRDLIVAVAKVAQKNTKLIIDEQSKEYWRWRDSILTYEEVMLETLTFDLMVEHPYQRLFDQIGRLDLHRNKKLRDTAWTFCNDSCLTILPLLLEAREIAVSAICFASAAHNVQIDDINGKPWWEALGGTADKVTRAVNILTDFYKENPLRKQTILAPGSPVFNLESTRRTGEVTESIVYSQTDDGIASQNGTPMVAGSGEGGAVSQSPNNDGGSGSQPDNELSNGRSVLDDPSHPGDSDAGLKAAANDLDVHSGRPNGHGIPSPSPAKRKALEEDFSAEEEEGRASKRARTEEGDMVQD